MGLIIYNLEEFTNSKHRIMEEYSDECIVYPHQISYGNNIVLWL